MTTKDVIRKLDVREEFISFLKEAGVEIKGPYQMMAVAILQTIDDVIEFPVEKSQTTEVVRAIAEVLDSLETAIISDQV